MNIVKGKRGKLLLEGLVFGDLTVISENPNRKSRSVQWDCICKCGNRIIAKSRLLITGGVKSCGCFKRGGIPYRKYYEEISGGFWSCLIYSAKQRNLEFTISQKYAWELFLKQNRKCALSGLDLEFSAGYRHRSDGTASLDRIDSNKGYVEGNVQWLHKHINMMKLNTPEYIFIELCTKIANFDVNKVIEYPKVEEYGNLHLGYINYIKYCAARRKILYNITEQELWELFLRQKGICALSGLQIQLLFRPYYKNKNKRTASVDRIDSNKGYTIDNIQWVYKDINNMKRILDNQTFIHYCKLISNKAINTYGILEK